MKNVKNFMKSTCIIGVFMLAATSCCGNKEYDNAVAYLDQLQDEVNRCYTQDDWNAVYNKVAAVNNDPRYTSVDNKYSANQAKTIKTRTTALIYTAIAKQTILWNDLRPLREVEAKLPQIIERK